MRDHGERRIRGQPALESADRDLPADTALAVVAHAASARPDRFCLFPNPTARR